MEQKQKRPLESGDASQPEKRAKIEHSRTPSNSLNSLPRKPETPTGKLGLNLHKTSHSSPLPKKEPSNKPNHTSKPSSEKPLDLPPLLSPLPADLDSSPGLKPTSGFKKSESGKNSSQSTPSKLKVGSDTIVVKKPSPMESSPLSEPPKSPLAPLPALLSPTLPQVIEDELIRLQQKSAEKAEKHALSTAEARYEKSRQPDTPGVARKTVIPKVGHPPKKTGESSKSKDRPEKLIIKLKYKKRKANDIRRILGLKPHPDRRFLELEKERIRSTSKAPDTEDEDDVPLSKIATKPTSAPISKKRSSDSFESRTSEPATKRPKGPEPIDVSKSHKTLDPPFKSPALTAPSQKSLLSTPKKSGDAMKSVAMRRVDSTDALSRTPQTSTSTPASAEKPRLNGVQEHERPGADEKKFGESALRLKRKMDEYLKTKGGNRDTITERERKLGVCYGLECLVAYMNTWVAQAKRPGVNDKAWIDGVRLWEFINAEARTFPVLSLLSCQVGALMREEVNRIYVRMVEEKREGGIEGLGANQRGREKCWTAVGRGRGLLREFGIQEVLGPWSSAGEALGYTYEVLEKFCRREKLEWKRDAV